MLRVENATLSFDGLYANKDITFNVKEGEITALIGPNGAGKTTLFNLLSGVYKPTSGEITFLGERIDGLQPYRINERGISRTYQVINLFSKMTVVENVMVGMHTQMKQGFFASLLKTGAERKEENKTLESSLELLEFVGLREYADHEASSLSYGDQRRLEIVRSLASNPKLILLDEPAAGMNSREKEELTLLIRQIMARNVTVLIIEHDMKLIMGLADKIFVLNHGQLLAQGTPDEIQKNHEVIAAYLGGE